MKNKGSDVSATALLLGTAFGFEANPHPENGKSAGTMQALLAARIETEGNKSLAEALRADLKSNDPAP